MQQDAHLRKTSLTVPAHQNCVQSDIVTEVAATYDASMYGGASLTKRPPTSTADNPQIPSLSEDTEIVSHDELSLVTFEQLCEELQGLKVCTKEDLEAWALKNIDRCARLGKIETELLKIEFAKRDVSKNFLDRTWSPLVRQATKVERASSYLGHRGSVERYVVLENRICDNKPERSGAIGETGFGVVPLCNFNAQIVANVQRDDGETVSHHFAMNGILHNGKPLKEILVKAEDFEAMRWPIEQWGAEAIIEPGKTVRDTLRHAIQSLSEARGIEQRTIYTHTGWRIVNNKRVFLTASSALGTDGIGVELPPNLSGYSLPVDQDVSEVDAMRKSLELLDISTSSVSYPILASMYLAPLTEIIAPPFVLWIEGASGSLKSSFAAVMLNHFGERFNEHRLPADWISTANSLEKLSFYAKDVPFLIDDFRPATNRYENEKLQDAASRLIRAAGNRSGRSRLDGDAELQRTFEPRGLILSTAERGAMGKSVNARLLTVAVEPGDINPTKLSEAQSQRQVYGYAMRGYLQWVSENWDRLVKELPGDVLAIRSQYATGGQHRRLPDATATLYVAFNLAINYAIHIGAIAEQAGANYCNECLRVLRQLADEQNELIQDEDPALKYLQIIINLLHQRKIQITGYGARDLGGPWGVKGKPNAEIVGWHKDGHIHLTSSAYNLVCQYAMRENWTFPSDQTALHKELDRQGYLASKNQGRLTLQVQDPQRSGKKYRVLVLHLNKVLDLAKRMGIPAEQLNAPDCVPDDSGPNNV